MTESSQLGFEFSAPMVKLAEAQPSSVKLLPVRNGHFLCPQCTPGSDEVILGEVVHGVLYCLKHAKALQGKHLTH